MKNRKIIILVCLLIGILPNANAQLVINELMQSNVDCIMDDMNEFPDSWVEIYNTGDASVNLQSYSIGVSRIASDAYQLPNEEVLAKGYALVYCDKKNTGMHASFRLESSKTGAIYLFQNNVVVDSVVSMAAQPSANIAYGRQSDGSNVWGYLVSPTPNKANCGQIALGVLGEPIFSRQGCVMEAKQRVVISLALPVGCPEGTEIRYTLDGSEPTVDSRLYTSAFFFDKSTSVRAKLFCQGYVSPRATTQSYIMLGRSCTLPVVSITTDDKYLYDNQIGIYVDGNYQVDRKNYSFNWHRPVNIEYFPIVDSVSVLNQLAEARVQGGASRGNVLKSLAIYANKRFGKGKFKYEFFPGQRPGENDYKSLVLRNAGNDFDYLYMRDAIIQRSMAQYADLDWQAWQPTIVFFNGVYKGILNIRERSNEENIYTNYDGLEDIDMIENGWDLKKGTWDNWHAFQQFYSEHGHTWAEYEQWMDCKEYINFMLMNLFYNNLDFPANNVVYWRPRQATDSLKSRWRFIAKDTDYSLGIYDISASYKVFDWFYYQDYDPDHAWGNTCDATRLFRRLMEDPTFQREFVDRSAIYIGDFLNYDNVWSNVWQPMYQQIQQEYPVHRKLFNEWWPNYAEEMRKAQQWLQARPQEYLSQLQRKYELTPLVPLQINNSLTDIEIEELGITFNDVKLTKARWNGQFFTNRVIRLTAISNRAIGWTAEYFTTSGSREQTWQGKHCEVVIPANCTRVVITTILGEPTAIEETFETETRVEKYMRNGQIIIRKNGVEYDVLGNIL